MKKLSVGIVGASGLVGSRLANLVADKLNCTVTLFGNKSANKKMIVGGKVYKVQCVDSLVDHPLDMVGFCADNQVSARWIPLLTQKGVVCVDNSAHFRLHKNVPLVVPGVNDSSLPKSNLYANPNCTTIGVAMAVAPLVKQGISSLNVVTMQSASGAGGDGLEDLCSRSSYGKLKAFAHPIYDNVIPQIGNILTSGYTTEEMKLKQELKKILCLKGVKINSFCARVPVTIGHCAVVTVKLKNKVDVTQIRQDIALQPNVLVFDNREQSVYPMPLMIRQTKFVGVGRIVKANAHTVNMFVVEDNLLRGAAYNALEIMEKVAKTWLE